MESRQIILINDGWEFSKDNTIFEIVTLPHTWNGIDGQDGGNDYYRGKCYYRKNINKSDLPDGDEIWLQCDGVNSSAEVIFNGKSILIHHGGYSTFRVKLDDIKDNNELVITADNSPNDFVYPQQADFTFYGGIYRDVKLIGLNKIHFETVWGADAFKITPTLNNGDAIIKFDTKTNEACEIVYEILDGDDVIYKGRNAEALIEAPHLWNGTDDPYLYTANAYAIVDHNVVDKVTSRFGIRTIEFDADKGFILNGVEYPLRGVSRHQDRPQIGNALKYEHHKEDIDLICEMGANTVRLAHYQHSQDFYDLCDERGLIVWAEIPYISRHMPKGFDNTITQMNELIHQNYNHPSIVTWGLSNEITMGGANDKGLLDNHYKLNDLCHELDATRPTTLAVVTMCGIDEEYVHLTDIVSYNHYFGWYGGSTEMNGPWFDKFHKKYPTRPIGISEYGCEALNWHTSEPEQGDYTEEYQSYYHEQLIMQIMDRPYLWATHVWNMFDFAADARSEGGENGMNHKGLVTFDRKYKKDSFYAYKAWLSKEPVLHICSKRYIDRVEDVTKVTVYSNQEQVELFANGKSVQKQSKGKYPFFYFEVENIGETEIKAVAGDLTNTAIIRKVDKPNPDYTMVEEGSVINWFEISTPSGYCSVNDTLETIMKTTKGKLVLLSAVPIILNALKPDNKDKSKEKKDGGFSVAGFKINKSILDMAKGFTIKRALSMIGNRVSKEDILKINKRLNRVKKK